MAFMAPVLPFLAGGLVGGAASALMKPKSAPAAVAQPVMRTRSTAFAASDALARRRGARSNQRTGSGGAESSTSAGKALMGQ